MTDRNAIDIEIRNFLDENKAITLSLQEMDPDKVVYPEGKRDESDMEAVVTHALAYLGTERPDCTKELTHLIVAIARRSTREDASEDFRSAVENHLDVKVTELKALDDSARLEPMEKLQKYLQILRRPDDENPALENMRDVIKAATRLSGNPDATKNQKPDLN